MSSVNNQTSRQPTRRRSRSPSPSWSSSRSPSPSPSRDHTRSRRRRRRRGRSSSRSLSNSRSRSRSRSRSSGSPRRGRSRSRSRSSSRSRSRSWSRTRGRRSRRRQRSSSRSRERRSRRGRHRHSRSISPRAGRLKKVGNAYIAGHADEVVQVMTVKDSEVAYVVGRGGSTKKRLENFSRCTIEISSEGTVTITGPTQRQVDAARLAIEVTLTQQKGPAAHIKREAFKGRSDCDLIWVPKNCIGYVIGKQGATLRIWEEKYKVFVFLDNVHEENGRKTLFILGESAGREYTRVEIDDAVRKKQLLLSGQTHQRRGAPPHHALPFRTPGHVSAMPRVQEISRGNPLSQVQIAQMQQHQKQIQLQMEQLRHQQMRVQQYLHQHAHVQAAAPPNNGHGNHAVRTSQQGR